MSVVRNHTTLEVAPAAVAPAEDGATRKVSKRQYYGKTARRGAVWSIVRQGGNEFVAIPTSMIMARLLAPSDFGIAATATFFIVLATRLTQFGFNAALVRIKDLRPDHLSTVFVVNAVLGAGTYVVLVAVSPFIGTFLRNAAAGHLLILAASIFLITPFGTVPAALLTRHMQFRFVAVTEWIDTIVGAVVSIALALWGYGYWSLVIGQLAGTALRIVLRLFYSHWRPSLRCTREALRDLLSFGLGLQAKRLLEYASFNFDNIVVGRVLGMTALGFYDKAFTTMNRLVNRLTLGDAYFRIFSIIHEEPERFRRAYSKLLLTVSLIGLPAFATAIVVAKPLFIIMYGDKWLAAVVPFQVLCAGGFLKLLNGYASQANEAVGNIWPQARRQAAGAIMIVVGAWTGSRYGGMTGAAIGVALALAALTVSMQALVRRSTGLSWREMVVPFGPSIVGTGLIVSVLLLVNAALHRAGDPAAWQILTTQLIAGAVCYVLYVLFNPFRTVRTIVSEAIADVWPGAAAVRWLPKGE
jgi:O-antigen/teichoic acid export membrane protein